MKWATCCLRVYRVIVAIHCLIKERDRRLRGLFIKSYYYLAAVCLKGARRSLAPSAAAANARN
jgi:hypothetical protein